MVRTISFISFLLLLIVVAISCSTKNRDKLPQTELLAAIDSITLHDKCYYTAMIYDSLVLLTTDCDTNYFHIYSKNTLRHILSFGKKGKGPSDFSSPFPFKTNSLILEPFTALEYFNLNSPLISSIDFSNITKYEDILSHINTTLIDIDLFMNIELNKINESEIAGIDIGRPNGLFFIYNSNSKTKKWIEFSPKLKSFDSRLTSTIYAGSLCTNRKVLVFANKFFDEISFYRTDGNLIKKYNYTYGSQPSINSNNNTLDTSSKIYFTKSYATSSNYYVLRLNNSIEAVRKTTKLESSLLIFDWNSNLIKNFGLSSLPVCFCVDETDNMLFTIEKINSGEGLVCIKKYNLKY